MRRLSLLILSLAIAATTLAPAVAQAAARSKAPKPVITRVTPMRVTLGETLVIRGKHFRSKPRGNTVVFQGASGRTVFVKPRRATSRKLVVKVTAAVARLLAVRDSRQVPTRIRLRVLTSRFSDFTPRRLSPVVLSLTYGGPGNPDKPVAGPLNVCNSDADHDNDLLPNQLELTLKTDPCLLDTDGDGLEDGFEYRSATDLNDDEFQAPNISVPYPGKRPYPNPLDPSDAGVDYDGDSLTQSEEQRLWRYAVAIGTASRTLSPLSYSDGEQYSMSVAGSDGHRDPTLAAAGYERQASFLGWAAANGYRSVALVDHDQPWWDPSNTRTAYGLLDFNRSGDEASDVPAGYSQPETTYYDLLPDGYLSDDERDEDADGLTNYDESHGRMTQGYWAGCYSSEKPFEIAYGETALDDPDSDGDTVRDGADDQDHDDIPNLMELSRRAASGLWDAERPCVPAAGLPSPPATNHPDAYGRVNPFNPCLPAALSRTCTLHPDMAGDSAPFDGSLDWASLN